MSESEALLQGGANHHIWVILGGTGFIGKHLMKHPAVADVAPPEVVSVISANRGNPHWGGTSASDESGKANFHHHMLDWDDRDDVLEASLGALTQTIVSVAKNTRAGVHPLADGTTVSFIDFSCTEPRWMRCLARATLKPLMAAGLLHLYVYVSTDSVYASANGSPSPSNTTTTLVHESNPTRVPPQGAVEGTPSSSSSDDDGDSSVSTNSTSSSSSSDDLSYGDEKRACEMILEHHLLLLGPLASPPPQLIILRLPDVVGPYDSTGRFWATVMWLQVHIAGLHSPKRRLRADGDGKEGSGGRLRVPLPTSCARAAMSIVAAKDVCDVIATFLLNKRAQPHPYRCAQCHAEPLSTPRSLVLHVACPGPTTLSRMLERMSILLWEDAQQHRPVLKPLHPKMMTVSIEEIDERADDAPDFFTPDFYPSVDCGPLDTSRYVTMHQQTLASSCCRPLPTLSTWEEAVDQSAAFFASLSRDSVQLRRCSTEMENALRKLPREQQSMWKELFLPL